MAQPWQSDDILSIECVDCGQMFGVGGMRAGVRNGAPIFRCRQCFELFQLERLKEEEHWKNEDRKVQEQESQVVAVEQYKSSITGSMLKIAYEAADMEAVADELVDLFGGNKGIAESLFLNWAQSQALKPGGKQALEALKVVMNAVHVATQRRPPKGKVEEMSDEDLMREISQHPEVLKITKQEGVA